MITTYKYRIKDSASRNKLCKLAGTVNFVWNYINELHKNRLIQYKRGSNPKFLSVYDIYPFVSGSSKDLGLPSRTTRAIVDKYVYSRKTHRKWFLRWRSTKRSLGWIPFKDVAIQFKEDIVFYFGQGYRIYKDRSPPVGARILCGSFNQDSKGRWFVSITFEQPEQHLPVRLLKEVGIDPGIKNALALSNGSFVPRPDLTAKYADKLARAQRACKRKLTTTLHSKIKNSRNDFLQKETTKIAKQYSHIYFGDASASKLTHLNKGLSKNILDASWHRAKTLLAYKAVKLGGVFVEVSERYTSQDCSSCAERTGPQGLKGLSVREWKCSACNAEHNRDTNSAKNILRLGHETLFQETQ